MKKNNQIQDVWTYNGGIYATYNDGDEPVQIRHTSDIDFFLEDDTFSSTCSGYSEYKDDFEQLQNFKWNTFNVPSRINNEDVSVGSDFNSSRNISSSTNTNVERQKDSEIPKVNNNSTESVVSDAGDQVSSQNNTCVSVLIHQISPKNPSPTKIIPNVPRVIKV